MSNSLSRYFSEAARGIRRRRPLDLIVFLLIWPLLWMTSLLSPQGAVRLGRWAGSLAFYLDGRHRRVTLKNLEIAFPSLSAAERRRIALRAFENVGKTFVELPGLGRQSPEDILSRVRFVNWDQYRKLREVHRGVLVLTGHLGNWELMALAHGFNGEAPLSFVARPLDNIYLERWVAGIRCRSGNRVINKRGALRQVVRSLREGHAVGLLMDQSTTGSDSVNVDFFSHPAGSSPAIAYLAVRSGAQIIPIYTVRDPDGTGHTIYAEEPVTLQRTGARQEDLQENTRRCQKVLEDIIRKHPDQWFWMHRRWKRAPGVSYK